LIAQRIPILQPLAVRAAVLEGDDRAWKVTVPALADRRRAGGGKVTSAASSSWASSAFESIGGFPVRSSKATSG
jgi:hypothetical protein